jgi:hypothetical protein
MRLLLEKLLDILEAVLRFRHRRNGKAEASWKRLGVPEKKGMKRNDVKT